MSVSSSQYCAEREELYEVYEVWDYMKNCLGKTLLDNIRRRRIVLRKENVRKTVERRAKIKVLGIRIDKA